ncbi:antibiotic biosynthesis monooxygenase [uncultured Shewanella sp.]|uniref:putative quinol monooxygenase n=1 Tax=uncultured Shewanella sp. TaxID=173975 RepID=UPI00261F856B|nr:antibiotic biosynthesis monooxygenase [uncultured Shewanella sp.]
MTSLSITAGLKVTKNHEPNVVKRALLSLQALTIQEKGCIKFEILQHIDLSERFTLWETWENTKAFERHHQMQYTQEYLAKGMTEILYIDKLTLC